MLQRCLDMLAPALERPGAVVVDCTLGLGGHSEALLGRFPEARLVALDRDKEALRLSGERLAPFGIGWGEFQDALKRSGSNFASAPRTGSARRNIAPSHAIHWGCRFCGTRGC